MNRSDSLNEDFSEDRASFSAVNKSSFEETILKLKTALHILNRQLKKGEVTKPKDDKKDKLRIFQLQREIEEIELKMKGNGDSRPKEKEEARQGQVKPRETELKSDEKMAILNKQISRAKDEENALADRGFTTRVRLCEEVDTAHSKKVAASEIEKLQNEIELLKTELGNIRDKNTNMRNAIRSAQRQFGQYRTEKVADDMNTLKEDIRDEIFKAKLSASRQKKTSLRLDQLLTRHEREKPRYSPEVCERKMQLTRSENIRKLAVAKLDEMCGQQLPELAENKKVAEKTFMENEDKAPLTYEEALATIRKNTSESRIDVVSGNFAKKERDILRMAKYPNELGTNLTEMDQELQEYKDCLEEEQAHKRKERALQAEEMKTWDIESGVMAVTLEGLRILNHGHCPEQRMRKPTFAHHSAHI